MVTLKEQGKEAFITCIQGVSGRIVNILGGGNMDNSE
jgi:hypothetical protein